MRELLRKIAIVRQQEQSFALRIQAPDIEKARKLWRQQIENRVACVRIAPSGNKTTWFVQRERQRSLEMNELAINLYMVALVRLRAEICANATVDRHTSGCDQFITFSPRANAGCSEEAI